jgi:hypothetical protein
VHLVGFYSISIGTEVPFQESSRQLKVRENWFRDSHALLKRVNESLTHTSTALNVCGLNVVREFKQRCSVILSIENRYSNCRPLLDGVNGILSTFSTTFARLHIVRYKQVSTKLYGVTVLLVTIGAVKTIPPVHFGA